jgi:hypothetical protein
VATHPDGTLHSIIFWVCFTDAERSDSEDYLDARSSSPEMVLFWEELRYSRKVITEDHPDAP